MAERSVPRLAPAVRLHGQMPGVGYTTTQWLVERQQQFLQLSELLYRVLEQIDGARSSCEIAARVTERSDVALEPDHVDYLVDTKLIPLGLVFSDDAPAAGLAADVKPGSSPLGLNFRTRVLPADVVRRVTGILQYAYAPLVLVPLLALIAVAHWWMYASERIGPGIERAFYQPGAMAGVLLLAIGAGLFHEFGHASALRYGGGTPRDVGFGLYLVFPAFYSDVTDGYRLHRLARIRTDLGGMYFHLILASALIGIAAWSGSTFLLSAAIVFDLEALRQFIPFVRLDGYWLLADLTGVPDFTSQIAVFRNSVGRARAEATAALPRFKPWVAFTFGAYLLLTIPALIYVVAMLVLNLPELLALTRKAFEVQTDLWASPLTPATRALVTLQIAVIPLPFAATVYFLYLTLLGLVAQLGARRGWSSERPVLRPAAGAAVVTAAGLVLAFGTPSWSPVSSANAMAGVPRQTDPLALISRVEQATVRVRSLRADLTGVMDGEEFRGSVALARPNLASVEVRGATEGLGNFSVHANGEKVFVFFPEEHKYTEIPASRDGSNITAFVVGQVPVFFKPGRMREPIGARLQYVGTERVEGRAYDVLEAKSSDKAASSWRYYVAQDDDLVHRIVTTSTRRGKTTTRTVHLRNVRVNEPVNTAQFAWSPPPGATTLGMDILGPLLPLKAPPGK